MSGGSAHGHDGEPVRGLPGRLPPGETILWQGAPDWKRLALTAYHVRGVAFYFALLLAWGLLSGAGLLGIGLTLAAGLAAVGVLALLAWASARTTIYTITNRRVVLRIGVALSTCVNVPLKIVGNAGVKLHADGSADIPLQLTGRERMGWMLLWPYARPWRIGSPEPMLRAVPDGERVAALLARALADAVPEGRRVPVSQGTDTGGRIGEAQAA